MIYLFSDGHNLGLNLNKKNAVISSSGNAIDNPYTASNDDWNYIHRSGMCNNWSVGFISFI